MMSARSGRSPSCSMRSSVVNLASAVICFFRSATEHDSLRAVSAAVDMQAAMYELNDRWKQSRAMRGLEPGPELLIHIGINSGPVAAGNIGSEHFLQYATIGDATNVASRVCGVAEATEIVIDDGTHAKLPKGKFRTEALPPTHVKGKSEPLLLHRVLWR